MLRDDASAFAGSERAKLKDFGWLLAVENICFPDLMDEMDVFTRSMMRDATVIAGLVDFSAALLRDNWLNELAQATPYPEPFIEPWSG